MPDFEVIKGDTLPPLDTVLYDGGQPVPLVGSTITVTVIPAPVASTDGTPPVPVAPIVDHGTAGADPEVTGRCYRVWNAGETDLPGRYTVRWHVTNDQGSRTYPTEAPQSLRIFDPATQQLSDLPFDPEDLAEATGADLPLDTETRNRFAAALQSACAEVQGYLNRPSLEPNTYTEVVRWPRPGDPFPVQNWPIISISTLVDLWDGYVQITYVGGIDARTHPVIGRYVMAAARADLANHGYIEERSPTSIVVEGQSIGYPTRPLPPPAGSAGAIPLLTELDPWRIRSVFSPSLPEDRFVRSRYRL